MNYSLTVVSGIHLQHQDRPSGCAFPSCRKDSWRGWRRRFPSCCKLLVEGLKWKIEECEICNVSKNLPLINQTIVINVNSWHTWPRRQFSWAITQDEKENRVRTNSREEKKIIAAIDQVRCLFHYVCSTKEHRKILQEFLMRIPKVFLSSFDAFERIRVWEKRPLSNAMDQNTSSRSRLMTRCRYPLHSESQELNLIFLL